MFFCCCLLGSLHVVSIEHITLLWHDVANQTNL
jgi:hypothetical protein